MSGVNFSQVKSFVIYVINVIAKFIPKPNHGFFW